MRDYYYLEQVPDADYPFTVEDLLHLGAIEKLKLYVHVQGPLTLRSEIDGTINSFDSLYLRLTNAQIRHFESEYVLNARTEANPDFS